MFQLALLALSLQPIYGVPTSGGIVVGKLKAAVGDTPAVLQPDERILIESEQNLAKKGNKDKADELKEIYHSKGDTDTAKGRAKAKEMMSRPFSEWETKNGIQPSEADLQEDRDNTLALVDDIRKNERNGKKHPLQQLVETSSKWQAGDDNGNYWDECVQSTCDGRIKGNTHLYITLKGAENLNTAWFSGHPVVYSRAIQKLLGEQLVGPFTCQNYMALGIWDMDKTYYDYGGLIDGGSHFYNPRGISYDGSSTTCKTYIIMGVCVGEDRTAAHRYEIYQSNFRYWYKLGGQYKAAACIELGKMFHLITDLVQPMHSSSLSGVSGFGAHKFHAHFEEAVPTIQQFAQCANGRCQYGYNDAIYWAQKMNFKRNYDTVAYLSNIYGQTGYFQALGACSGETSTSSVATCIQQPAVKEAVARVIDLGIGLTTYAWEFFVMRNFDLLDLASHLD